MIGEKRWPSRSRWHQSAHRPRPLCSMARANLRESMSQIAAAFGQAHWISVTRPFGPSGRMRERIERGEHVDLFTSVYNARKLAADGRANVMAVFARNTVCLLSPPAFGATTDKSAGPVARAGGSGWRVAS
jgi:molybdate transport system substrate-binding protein